MIRFANATVPPLLLIILIASVAASAPLEPRSYAPVQAGPGAESVLLSPYAPGRVLVRLTDQGYRRSALDADMTRGARAPGALTGLAGVDAAAAAVGVTGVVRAHGPFPDMAAAELVGAQRAFIFELPSDADVPEAAARLAAEADVESATPDWRLYPAYVPNDFSYPANWGHDNQAQLPGYDWFVTYDHTLAPVGMPGFDADTDMAWDAPSGFGSPSVVIAIIDTGVDQAHADLLQVPGYDYGDMDPNPHDDAGGGVAGHGTCCAGIAAAIADNVIVAAGVAGGCAVMPLKVADSAGNLYLSYAANALYHAANNGANVASMSFSTAGITTDPNMDPALQYAYNAGVTLVAAAGNDNNSVVDYPANTSWVIAVGAASPCGERKRSSNLATELAPFVLPDPLGYTCDGERWWGSNYGNVMQGSPGALDMLAPTILPTTDITGAAGYRSGDFEPWFNGTSCSAPYVAGVCALVLSANPGGVSPADMRIHLTSTCTDVVSVESTPGWDIYSGFGLVNANMAVITPVTPVAGFMASTTNGCVPLMVNFTDMSMGSITSWSWNFGDGGTDIVPNPSYMYSAPGTYTVTLTVSGPTGTDTMTQTNLITVDGPVVSDFTATPLQGYAPLTVTFTDASTGAPVGWNWDFGDGQMSNAQSPTNIYGAPGLYTVMLGASNGCGGDMMTKVDYVTVCGQPPVAGFTASATTGADTLTVTFTDNSGGEPTDWAWDFGDGGSGTGPNPTHFYSAPGRYTVRLIASTPCDADTSTVADMIVLATTTASGGVPARFELGHSVPNPFNPTTTIHFSLPNDAHARLEIFDASGRSLGAPIDRAMPAGRHEYTWRPERLPSGVYFFKLTAGAETGVRRVVLIR